VAVLLSWAMRKRGEVEIESRVILGQLTRLCVPSARAGTAWLREKLLKARPTKLKKRQKGLRVPFGAKPFMPDGTLADCLG
jgi:hypothetical protein